MLQKIRGALKAVSVPLAALAAIGVNALLGFPVDLDAVKTLVAAIVSGLLVYAIPNQ